MPFFRKEHWKRIAKLIEDNYQKPKDEMKTVVQSWDLHTLQDVLHYLRHTSLPTAKHDLDIARDFMGLYYDFRLQKGRNRFQFFDDMMRTIASGEVMEAQPYPSKYDDDPDMRENAKKGAAALKQLAQLQTLQTVTTDVYQERCPDQHKTSCFGCF